MNVSDATYGRQTGIRKPGAGVVVVVVVGFFHMRMGRIWKWADAVSYHLFFESG